MRYEGRPYQQRMTAEVVAQNTLLAAPPGLGKTAAALDGIDQLVFDHLTMGRVLVVAPKIVATDTWPNEIAKWDNFHRLTHRVWRAEDLEFERVERRFEGRVVGSKLRPRHGDALRERIVADDAVIHLVSRDNFLAFATVLGKAWPYDMLVLDESIGFADGDSKRFQMAGLVAPMCQRVVLLNGTPTGNRLEALHYQLQLVDGGAALGRSVTDFRMQWMTPDRRDPRRGRVFTWKAQEGAFGHIVERCRGKILTMKETDWLDLPDRIDIDQRVTIPRAEYDRMERDSLLPLVGADAIAVNAGVLYNKLAQISCLAGDTDVLTNRGWVPIASVSTGDCVWDGGQWVAHSGVISKGVRPVIQRAGVWLTPNHLVMTTAGWKPAEEVRNGDDSEGFDRAEVRLPDSFGSCRVVQHQNQSSALALPLRLRHRGGEAKPVAPEDRQVSTLWVPAPEHSAREDQPPVVQRVGQDEATVPEPRRQRLAELWREGHLRLRSLAGSIRVLLGGHERVLPSRADAGPERQRRPLLPGELSVGDPQTAAEQQAQLKNRTDSAWRDDSVAGGRSVRDAAYDALQPSQHAEVAAGSSSEHSCPQVAVFDIVNCGPQSCFTVRGATGEVSLVHNCGIVFDEVGEWHEIHRIKLEALEAIVEAHDGPLIIWTSFQPDVARIRKLLPTAKTVSQCKNLERDWNAGLIPYLIAHPDSLGFGANLQDCPGSGMVWFGITGNAVHYLQAIKRLHRGGRKEPVRNYRIVAHDTVEDAMLDRLGDRTATHNSLIDALAYRRGRVLRET